MIALKIVLILLSAGIPLAGLLFLVTRIGQNRRRKEIIDRLNRLDEKPSRLPELAKKLEEWAADRKSDSAQAANPQPGGSS